MSETLFKDNAERVYDALYEEEDARVCKDISDAACTNVPPNFFLNAGAVALGKVADAVANTKTTLPWLLATVGAPGWVISALVPIRESGSMLPQLAIGAWVRQRAVRKWFYVAGALTQALAMFAIVASLLVLSGYAAGIAVLGCVIVFSLARGFCSVAAKDVQGKTVPKTRRGRVNGLSASIAGMGTLVAAAVLYQLQAGEVAYLSLIAIAGGCWLLAAAAFARISEDPGASEGGVNGLSEAVQALSLLREDAPFRNFVLARALLVGTALAAPFIVVMARERSDAELAYFLFAQGAAALLSGNVWGRFADYSSRLVLLSASVASGLLGLGIFLVDQFAVILTQTAWFLPSCFFLLMILHDGVRLGRKTYVVDLASGNKRTDYVAVSNTLLGAVLLLAGAVAAAVQTYGNAEAILFCAVIVLVAAALIVKLPEVQS